MRYKIKKTKQLLAIGAAVLVLWNLLTKAPDLSGQEILLHVAVLLLILSRK